MSRDASALARNHTEKAIETVADVLNDPFAENKDRLKAAELMLDRGHGKAAQAVIQVPANRRQAEALARLSDDELMNIIQSRPLPRLRADAIDVPAEDASVVPSRAARAVQAARAMPVALEDDPLLA